MKFTFSILLSILLVISTPSFGAKTTCNMNDPDLKALNDDLKKNSGLLDAIKKNYDLLDAWDSLFEAGATQKKRSAIELLNGIDSHFSKEPFKGNSSLQHEYIQAVIKYKGKISTNSGNQGSERFPEKAEVFFNTLFDYTKKFHSKNGFTLKDTHGQLYTQDGFYFAMKFMNDKISPSTVTKIDMRFENSAGQCPNCRFDLQVGTPPNATQYEFKSYGKNTPLKQTGQFISYLESSMSLDSIKYVFNKDKVNIQQAQDKMKTFITNNKEEFFETIKQNIPLSQTLSIETNDTIDKFTDDMIDTIVNNIVTVY